MTKKLHPAVRALLDEIYAFCASHDLTRTKFGILAVHDGLLIPRLEAGRMPTLQKIDRIREFMQR